jgi:hypothetical protein
MCSWDLSAGAFRFIIVHDDISVLKFKLVSKRTLGIRVLKCVPRMCQWYCYSLSLVPSEVMLVPIFKISTITKWYGSHVNFCGEHQNVNLGS